MKNNMKMFFFVFLIFFIFLFLNSSEINRFIKNISHGSSHLPKTIVIDPGHGGIDSGTMKNGLLEKDITLSIAKKLQAYLKYEGYVVMMTRVSDIYLSSHSNVSGSDERKDLDARVNFAKLNNAKLFISIHVDSLPGYPEQSGSVVYYYPKLIQSKILATNIQNSLNRVQTGDKPRTKNVIQEADFYVLKNSEIPSVLVETAYITNKQEQKLLSKDEFKEKLAKAVSEGIKNSKLVP
jgi:N-acetylmuramoyl-L-alanine amidase